MNVVSPIRDPQKVKDFKNEAKKIGDRTYLIVQLGLNTGLRISDLLEVTAGDIRKGFIVRREKKTGKQTEIRFNPAVVAELQKLTSTYPDNLPLAYSKRRNRIGKSVTRDTVYKWLNKAARQAGIKEPVGNHTLRKTYGYHFYLEFKDIATLMHHYNHSSEAITMRYIGVTQEQVNKKTEKFRL